MDKKRYIKALLNTAFNFVLLVALGGGLVLSLLFSSLGNDILTSWRFLSSVVSQVIILVYALINLFKNLEIVKSEKKLEKQEKLDKEITKRAAEIIKEKEENSENEK
jgi:TRAP-type C4-dicarboxylate transport system permease small subunit